MREDFLSPSESGKWIAANSKNVVIKDSGLETLCEKIISSMQEGKISFCDVGAGDIHPGKDEPSAVDWIFVLDALNFCFWTTGDSVEWKVLNHTGYNAFAAAIKRAIKEGCDIFNPEVYSKLELEKLRYILRSDDGVIELQLLKERLDILHEVGDTLIKKFNGTFETCVRLANKSAINLLTLLVTEFKSFRDESFYNGRKVSFYKRAQILVADLWNTYNGESWGQFYDIEQLTMFADYRVPQVLVWFGVLEYSENLMALLQNDTRLQAGSPEEAEIRGCSIHAVEMLKTKLFEKIKGDSGLQVPHSILLDYFLWCYRRNHSKELERIPFHKVISIYY